MLNRTQSMAILTPYGNGSCSRHLHRPSKHAPTKNHEAARPPFLPLAKPMQAAGLGLPSPVQTQRPINPRIQFLAASLRWAAIGAGIASPLSSGAQTLAATVATAPLPTAVLVNPVTNKIYVSSGIASGQVTVIDGDTNSTTAVAVGSYPTAMDVNTATNKIYVANSYSSSVTVIDGATNATTTIPVGANPSAIAVNMTTNTVFVVYGNIVGGVSVIDGATNAVTGTIFAGYTPGPSIAVDPANNRIFAIAGSTNLYTVGSQTVYVIDVASGAVAEAELGQNPVGVYMNPVSGQLFVANFGGEVHVITFANSSISSAVDTPLEVSGLAIALNTVTDKAYFTDSADYVRAIDGKNLTVTLLPLALDHQLGNFANLALMMLAVDPVANIVYAVPDTSQGYLVTIDPVTGLYTAIPAGTLPVAVAVNPVTHKVYVVNNDSAGTVSIINGLPAASAPTITAQPQPQTVNTGSTVAFSVVANARPSPTYQWTYNGAPLSDGGGVSGSSDVYLVLSGPNAVRAGTYACTVTNASGSATSSAANLSVVAADNPGRIINLSTRASISPSGSAVEDILFTGFVISGTGSKSLIVRGIGPALAEFGLSGVIEDPTLALYDSATSANLITRDAAWQMPPMPPATAPWLGTVSPTDATESDFAKVGAFALPQGSADTAVKISLPAGAYTTQISSAGGNSGIVLAELYDDDPGSPASQLINISSRGLNQRGSGVMIAGFEISGSSAETVLIRASGPALAALGVSDTALTTTLQLYDSGGNLIASNQKWEGDPQITAIAARVGAFTWTDPNSLDSALITTLPPGGYTAEIDPSGYAGGEALIEVYAIP
jgi:YVTN family beta-propeller protein